MPRLRVHAFSLSLDGYGAERNPKIDNHLVQETFSTGVLNLGYAPADT